MNILQRTLLCITGLCQLFTAWAQDITNYEPDFLPGIHKVTVGTDCFTPLSFCPTAPDSIALQELSPAQLPFALSDIILHKDERGCSLSVPLADDEELYGFGLQIGSYRQRGLRKRPIVNDYPLNNLGFTHAPQTFYLSTAGYGIVVNTARYTTFMCGTHEPKRQLQTSSNDSKQIATDTQTLYANQESGHRVYIDVPNAKGIEVFVIAGSDIKQVVERYNLLSGGGCLPPLWGLGFKYRVKGDYNSQQVVDLARYFRNNHIPCDVLGLEPGWQTAAYSCSYVWNRNRFANPEAMIDSLRQQGFRVNLWEHAYVHPTSPLFQPLYPYSGDFLVWKGLVPDFSLPETRRLFTGYHRQLLQMGISGFKLDECDNSNIASGDATWGFPDMTRFPSGMDGERMHQLFGSLYLQTMNNMYRENNLRTYQDYRSSGLFTASLPATLYSDIYGHKDYIQMICNSSFGGLLWSPEVRESSSKEEFFHRLQTTLLSAHAIVNAWYLQYPPWLQYDKDQNNQGKFLADKDEMEDTVRQLINQRMSLVPYLYAAFADYHYKGTPPFRALVLDYPTDPKVYGIDNQYMIGDWLMAAPLSEAGNVRKVYFPTGVWYNLHTNERYEGGKEYTVETPFNTLPLYVKAGAILPLAEPVTHITENTLFNLHCRVYGDASATTFKLHEDDGISYDFESGNYNQLTLSLKRGKGVIKRSGPYKGKRYQIKDWTFIP